MKNRSFRNKLKRIVTAMLCGALITVSSPLVLSTDAVTAVAGRTEEELALVYAHSEYDISLRNAVYASGGSDDGKRLTDTKYSSVVYEEEEVEFDGWTVIKSYNGEADYRVTVTMDMGFTAKDVCLFFTRAFNCPQIGAKTPDEVRFYCSEDGESFSYIGQGTTTTDLTGIAASAVYRLNTKEGHTARYIRVTMDCSGGSELYLNEFGAAARGTVFRSNADSVNGFNDTQGVTYRINSDIAEVIGAKNIQSGSHGEIAPSSASFNQDGLTYTLGEGTDNEVKVISDFIGEGYPNYSGVPNNINYIVIHNTGTTDDETDAERYNYRMHNTTEEKSWHYTVDSGIIYHSLSDNVVGWHAGASHNYESIGIEICTNGAPTRSSGAFVFQGEAYDEWVETTFRPALKNAAMLTAELLTRYGLGLDAVIQHYDVTEKNCPLWLRYKDGKYVSEGTLWVEFMGYVEEYYCLLNGENPSPVITPLSKIVLPDYIEIRGDIYPLQRIAAGAFINKGAGLQSLTISKNISEISANAFNGCTAVKLTVDEGNGNFTVGAGGVLFDENKSVIFDPQTALGEPPSPKEDCALDIREIDGQYYIFCLDEGYTLHELAQEYGAAKYTAYGLHGGTVSGAEVPSTGTLLNFDDSMIYLVSRGDMNGDGNVDVYDCLMLKSSFFGKYSPTQAQLSAVMISGGDELSVYDYMMLKSHILGKFNIYDV